MTIRFSPVLGAVAAMALLLGCQDLRPIKGKGRSSAGASSAVTTSGGPMGISGTSGPKVKVAMYIMSKCPFGVSAVDGFTPVLKKIGDRIDFDLEYIADQVPEGQACPRGKPSHAGFCALHGPPEVKGNIQQLCVRKHYPALAQWLPYVECQNKTWRNIPDNWQGCAQQTGLDVGKLSSCIDGAEGKQLQAQSAQKAKAARASGSPTIYVAGQQYSGGRAERDFLRAVCQGLQGQKPDLCSKIPEPVEVKVVILNDKRCTKCQTAGLESNLRGRFFPKLTVRTVDYGSAEGKKLFADLKLTHLPAWLFEPGVEKAENYGRISRWMEAMGNYKKLKVPATFDPKAEICDNKIDDTGNGLVDCADPTCKGKMECREEIKNKVDVFIMSQCPFGVQAVDAMKEVLANFGNELKFDVHYIADKVAAGAKCRRGAEPRFGFCALHGAPEVDENIRQLCAKKHYGKNNKYLDYLWCRNKNYRSNEWKSCAKDGIAADVIDKCFNSDEGKKLHEASAKLAQQLGVSGSPTWLANNRHKFSGIAADAIKQNICTHNKTMKNCDKNLTKKANVAGSCGG